MADQKDEGIKGYHVSWLFIGVVIIGWGFVNYNSTKTELKNVCLDNPPFSLLLAGAADKVEACKCVSEETIGKISPVAFIPFAGGAIVSKDEVRKQSKAAAEDAIGTCAARY